MNDHTKKNELFSSTPIGRAILTLAVPTIISQLITVIYNMADTFFIGQLGDPKLLISGILVIPYLKGLTKTGE